MTIVELDAGRLPMVGEITRRYTTPVEVADGRTVIGRCAPFDVVARVADNGVEYDEVIRAGAFRRSTKIPHRVMLNYEHRLDLGNQIGPGVELIERDDGLYGSFRALPGPLGDLALELIRSGACTGLSVSARLHPQGSRLVDGVVERRLLELDHVALTSRPAYEGAAVTAVRSAPARGAPSVSTSEILAKSAALRARFSPTPDTPVAVRPTPR